MIYRYVPHALVARYVALGWVDRGPMLGSHGVFSSLMRWEGAGEAVEPNHG